MSKMWNLLNWCQCEACPRNNDPTEIVSELLPPPSSAAKRETTTATTPIPPRSHRRGGAGPLSQRSADFFTERRNSDFLSNRELQDNAPLRTPREDRLLALLKIPPPAFDSTPPTLQEDIKGLDPEAGRRKIEGAYREFIRQMLGGVTFTQLTSIRDYAQVHCALSTDFENLTLDQNCGRLVEFPVRAMERVYVISKARPTTPVRRDSERPPAVPLLDFGKLGSDHITVVEFESRKLAFVFRERHTAERMQYFLQILGQQIKSEPVTNTPYCLTPRDFTPNSPSSGSCCDDGPPDISPSAIDAAVLKSVEG